MMQARIDMAVSKENRARAAAANAAAQALQAPEDIAAAALEGDEFISRSVSAMGRRDFPAAHQALNSARAAYARAGPETERARASTLENLFASLRAEQERGERVQKLLRQKAILAQAKKKQQAKELGLDPDLVLRADDEIK
uniref:Uncharacterized protein n=2 Tax=Chrysotila carterae TaxID=13221 RepID=A0A7S4B470_CHRCT